MKIYLYLFFILKKIKGKSIDEIRELSMKQKMCPPKMKRFIKAYNALNKLSKNKVMDKNFKLRCLNKSTALFYISRKCGIPVTLKIGMHHYGRFLSGHAWIEINGKPVEETLNVNEYKVIFSMVNV